MELLITISVVGLIAGMAVLALPVLRIAPGAGVHAAVATARQQALDSGRAMTLTIDIAGRLADVTTLPDGSVVADSAIGVDALSGALSDARR